MNTLYQKDTLKFGKAPNYSLEQACFMIM